MRIFLFFIFLMVTFGPVASAAPKPSEAAETYIRATQTADYATIAKLTDPHDLTALKEMALEAYGAAAAVVQKKGQVSSMVFTAFPSLDALKSASPEDVYVAIRKKTSPPTNGPFQPIQDLSFFYSFGHEGKTFLVIRSPIPEHSRDTFLMLECSTGTQLLLRLEPIFLIMLKDEIRRNAPGA